MAKLIRPSIWRPYTTTRARAVTTVFEQMAGCPCCGNSYVASLKFTKTQAFEPYNGGFGVFVFDDVKREGQWFASLQETTGEVA